MNKRDDQCGRAVPVQIPGARWGPCPPRDDVKTPSCSARIAGRGGTGSSTAASRCSVARSGRGGVAPRALSAPPARSRDRRNSPPSAPTFVCPARALARPPSAGSGPAFRRVCREDRRRSAVGRERAGDLEPALPARRRGERRPASRSPRPASSARAPAGRTDCARGLRPTGAPGVPLPARRIRSRRHRSRVPPSRDGVSTILGRRRWPPPNCSRAIGTLVRPAPTSSVDGGAASAPGLGSMRDSLVSGPIVGVDGGVPAVVAGRPSGATAPLGPSWGATDR